MSKVIEGIIKKEIDKNKDQHDTHAFLFSFVLNVNGKKEEGYKGLRFLIDCRTPLPFIAKIEWQDIVPIKGYNRREDCLREGWDFEYKERWDIVLNHDSWSTDIAREMTKYPGQLKGVESFQGLKDWYDTVPFVEDKRWYKAMVQLKKENSMAGLTFEDSLFQVERWERL